MTITHWVSDQIVSAGTPILYHIQVTPPTHLDPFSSWALPPSWCHVKRPTQHTPTHSMWTALIIPLKEGTFLIPSQSFQVPNAPAMSLSALPIQVLPGPSHYSVDAPFNWVLPPLPVMPLTVMGLLMIVTISGVWAITRRRPRPAPLPISDPPAQDNPEPSSALLLLLDSLNQEAQSWVPSLTERRQLRQLFRSVVAERYDITPQWGPSDLVALLGEAIDHDTVIILSQSALYLDHAVFSNHPITRDEWITAIMPLRRLLFEWMQPT